MLIFSLGIEEGKKRLYNHNGLLASPLSVALNEESPKGKKGRLSENNKALHICGLLKAKFQYIFLIHDGLFLKRDFRIYIFIDKMSGIYFAIQSNNNFNNLSSRHESVFLFVE